MPVYLICKLTFTALFSWAPDRPWHSLHYSQGADAVPAQGKGGVHGTLLRHRQMSNPTQIPPCYPAGPSAILNALRPPSWLLPRILLCFSGPHV